MIDGDHSYEGASVDFENAIKASTPGAYLVADDYTTNFPGVITAWDALVAESKVEEIQCQWTREEFRGYLKGWCIGRVVGGPGPAKRNIDIIITICDGDYTRLLEVEVTLKSVAFTADPFDHLHIHIILDDSASPAFQERIEKIGKKLKGWITIEFYPQRKGIFSDSDACSSESAARELVGVDCAIHLKHDALVLRSLNDLNDLVCGFTYKFTEFTEIVDLHDSAVLKSVSVVASEGGCSTPQDLWKKYLQIWGRFRGHEFISLDITDDIPVQEQYKQLLH